MLAKKYKLPIQEFVGRRGRIVKTSYFLVKIFRSAEDFSRFGVTVSAKAAKKASERNRVRRLVYNAIREYYSNIPAGDYWITVLPSAVSLSKESFIRALHQILL